MIQQSIKAATTGSCLFIGQDRCGRWVVRDAQRLCGGLFANQPERSTLRCTNVSAVPNPSSWCRTASSWMTKLHSPLRLRHFHLEGLGLAAPILV